METIVMDFSAGTSIEECAIALIAEARRLLPRNVTTEFSFNGCLLKATWASDVSQIVEDYRRQSVESAENFRASPDGRRQEADRLAKQQHILNAADPGLTIYTYDLDNSDGHWGKLDRGVWKCFELWDGIKPIDACIGAIPSQWPKSAISSGNDSPDRRIV